MTELLLPGVDVKHAVAPRPMIVVDDAHITYKVYASGKRMKAGDNNFSLRTLSGGRGLQEVHAVRGITFTASEGETIGVIGHNGSGKSTLFNAMSGLIPTSAGAIWARDRPVLLGVNAALVPQLSGENNIKLGLMAMGLSADEAAGRVGEIADFAELNEFIDHPMRTYSAGMGARLRFAIASAKAHSILLVDEALSVGDRRFKLKSEQRIRELRDSAGLVMIVSHSISSLKDTCERVLWVHKGELRADGPADAVIDEYVKWTKQPGSAAVGAASTPAPGPKAVGGAAGSKAAAGGKPAVDSAAESGLTDFEQLMVDATRSADAAARVAAERHSARDAARRERYRRTMHDRKRRRMIAAIITGAAIVLAVAAGAAIAFVAGLPRAAEPVRVSTPAASVSPSATASGGLVTIRGFTATAETVSCEAADGEMPVELSWAVDNAAMVGVASGAAQIDAIDAPLEAPLPATVAAYATVFPCAEESRVFSLTAEGADGTRVTATVTVARELADAGTDQQQTVPTVPRTSTTVAPVAPTTDPEPQPTTDPEPQPTTDPEPQPTTEPEPEPTTDPAPDVTPVG